MHASVWRLLVVASILCRCLLYNPSRILRAAIKTRRCCCTIPDVASGCIFVVVVQTAAVFGRSSRVWFPFRSRSPNWCCIRTIHSRCIRPLVTALAAAACWRQYYRTLRSICCQASPCSCRRLATLLNSAPNLLLGVLCICHSPKLCAQSAAVLGQSTSCQTVLRLPCKAAVVVDRLS
jgi:hypothetical protein